MYHRAGWKTSSQWTYPQLDIFWLDENSTHVMVHTEGLSHPKTTVYPLVHRPFHGRLVPAPRDPRRALEQIYTGDDTNVYDSLGG